MNALVNKIIKITCLLAACVGWQPVLLAHDQPLEYGQAKNGVESVRYCIDPDWMPYEAFRNGQHVGISADYLSIISDLSKIKFELVETESWDQSLAMLDSGQCQLTVMLNQTPERLKTMDFTLAYFEQANVFVTRESTPFLSGYDSIGDRQLAVVKNYRHAEYVERYYPDLNLKQVGNETEGMLLLASGEVDVFVGSLLSVTSRIRKLGLMDLKVAGLAKPHDELRMAVKKGDLALLASLNSAIGQITEAQHIEIFRRWNNVKVIDELDYRLIYSALAVFFVVISLFLWRNQYVARFNRKLMNKNELLESLQSELMEKNKTLEFLSTHDELTRLHNRHFMIRRCEEEILRNNRFETPACLILIDIDHFKKINDEYGHTGGDLILTEVTQLVQDTIREVDVVSRWGGEEFLVLCPQTKMTEANSLAVRLNKAVRDYTFSHVENLTCSFGVAQFKDSESFIHWFDRADAAMYEAKSAGRNRIFIAD